MNGTDPIFFTDIMDVVQQAIELNAEIVKIFITCENGVWYMIVNDYAAFFMSYELDQILSDLIKWAGRKL